MATSGTTNFPPNYVTLKQLHDQRLKEKQQAAEAAAAAEEERLRKLREAAAEEKTRRNQLLATGSNMSRHSAGAGPDGAPMSNGNPVWISRAAREPKRPLRPRRSTATAAGGGAPYRQLGAETLNLERKERREKYKGKGKEGKAGEKPETVAPEAEEPTVDGQDPRQGAESLMVLKRSKEGRRKEKGKEKEGKKLEEEVLELKPETGLAEIVPKLLARKRYDCRGPRQKGEHMWVAVVPARSEPEEVVKVVEQFDHLSVNVHKEMHAEEGNVVVAGKGKGKGRKSVDERGRGGNRGSRGFSRRVADGSVPVSNKVVERSEDIVINGGNETCNEAHTEANVVMAEKGRKAMAGRGCGRNTRFQGLGGFSKRAASGSVPLDGMVWVKKM